MPNNKRAKSSANLFDLEHKWRWSLPSPCSIPYINQKEKTQINKKGAEKEK
jgi:hypothetical protein